MIPRTKARLRLCVAVLCLLLTFIWGNSLLPGEVSGAFSSWIKDLLAALFPGVVPGEDSGHHLLRKLAHATEFACLGVCLGCLVRMLREKNWEHWLLPLLASFLVACLDETIQCFVPGRGPGLKDVGIDTLGAAAGVVLLGILIISKKKTIHLEENKS